MPDNSLVIVDRNFYDAAALFPLQDHGANRQWLIRTKSNLKRRTLKTLGPGDELVGTNGVTRIAAEAGVPPTRISFTMALCLIRDEWGWAAVTSPGAIPKHLRQLRADVARFVLPPRRTHRSYPRAVKLEMSNYARKRPVAK